MNDQERLFLAIGEADPELVARSERGRGGWRLGYGLAAAACLLLVLVLGRVLPLGPETVPVPPDSGTPPAVTPDSPEDPDGGVHVHPLDGQSAEGVLGRGDTGGAKGDGIHSGTSFLLDEISLL